MHTHIWSYNTTSIILVGCRFGQDAHLFWSFSKPSFVHPFSAGVRHPPLPLSVPCLFCVIVATHVSLFMCIIYKKAAIQVIYFISKPRYSQMAESENMSKPSRWATANQLGQKYNQQLLWQHTTDKPLFLQATKVEVYPIFLTEGMSQKLESIYWRGAICSRICSSNLATSYGINKRKSEFFTPSHTRIAKKQKGKLRIKEYNKMRSEECTVQPYPDP